MNWCLYNVFVLLKDCFIVMLNKQSYDGPSVIEKIFKYLFSPPYFGGGGGGEIINLNIFSLPFIGERK